MPEFKFPLLRSSDAHYIYVIVGSTGSDSPTHPTPRNPKSASMAVFFHACWRVQDVFFSFSLIIAMASLVESLFHEFSICKNTVNIHPVASPTNVTRVIFSIQWRIGQLSFFLSEEGSAQHWLLQRAAACAAPIGRRSAAARSSVSFETSKTVWPMDCRKTVRTRYGLARRGYRGDLLGSLGGDG